MSYALALGLTLLVELPLCTAVLRALARVGTVRASAVVLLVNCVTHPVLWWFLATGPAPYPLALAAAEGVVVLVEAVLLRLLLPVRGALPYALALTANAASLLAGLLLLPLLSR